MNALKVLGDLLDSSGWTGALTQANIASSDIADSYLKVSHVTCTRHAHVTCTRHAHQHAPGMLINMHQACSSTCTRHAHVTCTRHAHVTCTRHAHVTCTRHAHVTCTRRAHQVTASSLYSLLHKAYTLSTAVTKRIHSHLK